MQQQAAADVPLPGRGIKPLDSLRNHTRLAILTVLFVFIAGLPVVFLKGVVKYQTSATVQVAPRYMKNLKDDNELEFQSNQQYRQYVEQQTKTINRYDIVQKALRAVESAATAPPNAPAKDASTKEVGADKKIAKNDVNQAPDADIDDEKATKNGVWRLKGETERRAVERLQRELRILPVPDTYLIQISLEDTRKQGLADVLNAVVNAYLENSRQERLYGADDRVKQLQLREAELLKRTAALTQERSDLARQLGVTAFKAEDGNPFDKLAQKMREGIADARSKRILAEAQLAAFQQTGETDLVTRSVQESVLIDPGLNSLKSSLNNRRAILLSQMSGLAAEHPSYKAAQSELLEIETEIRAQTERLTQDLRQGLRKRYETAVVQARQNEAELELVLKKTESEGEVYASRFNRAVVLSADLEQLRKELESVRERLNFFAVETNSQGLVRPVMYAMEPDLPLGTGKKKLLIMVMVAAIVAGLMAPVVVDMLNRQVRTVNDAHRALGFAPLGWLIEQADMNTQRFAQDQLRRMASALIRDQDKEGTRTLAFTGVKPGAGTTRVVRELALVLNRLGVPTLALEANAFKPSPAYGDGVGLVQRLADPSAVQAPMLEVDGVPSCPVGNAKDVRHLDGLDRLGAWLEGLTTYRFVLIDAPPLLTSSDSEMIVRAAKAVVLVVEADGISAGELRRAARVLEKMDPPSVGAIVNRITPFHGGGYIQSSIAEYLDGRKQADPPMWGELKATGFALIWDAAALGLRAGGAISSIWPFGKKK
jgi:uncharacterized protein involved in exopolysaccharide biosynthesis